MEAAAGRSSTACTAFGSDSQIAQLTSGCLLGLRLARDPEGGGAVLYLVVRHVSRESVNARKHFPTILRESGACLTIHCQWERTGRDIRHLILLPRS